MSEPSSPGRTYDSWTDPWCYDHKLAPDLTTVLAYLVPLGNPPPAMKCSRASRLDTAGVMCLIFRLSRGWSNGDRDIEPERIAAWRLVDLSPPPRIVLEAEAARARDAEREQVRSTIAKGLEASSPAAEIASRIKKHQNGRGSAVSAPGMVTVWEVLYDGAAVGAGCDDALALFPWSKRAKEMKW